MKECFTSLNIKIYDNNTKVEILNYNVPQIRLLVPAGNSVQQAKAMCARELMKRANVQLPQALKKMNINQ
jgi:hypothetical protein